MATNFAPIYPAVYKTKTVSIGTAETSLTAPTNVGTLVTAVTGGTVVRKIYIKATGTTTAGCIRFFIHDGSAYFLIKEVNVTAITPVVGTTPAFESEWDPSDTDQDALFALESGYTLRVATHVAETFKLAALVEEYS